MNGYPADRVASGVDGLDVILGGGLVSGCAYIVQGPPGAGKTVLANQICFNLACAGLRSAYVSLLSESHDRMLGHMSTLAFYDEAAVADTISYISAFGALSADGLPGLLRLIHTEARRRQAALIVLDGLFVAGSAARDEREFRAFLHDLQGFASLSGCIVLALTNHNENRSGPERTMVDGGIELLDELSGAQSVRTVIVKKQRGASHLRGRHQFRISDAGVKMFPRLETVLSRVPAGSETTDRVSTGIADFDRMTGGGYPLGSASLLAGPSGTGKTTMGLQFLSQSTPDQPGLLFGFCETPARIRTKARSIGIDIDALLASGALKIIWHPPSENIADEVGHQLLDDVAARNVHRVFFDGIGALRNALMFTERLPGYLNAINNDLRAAETTIVYSIELPTLFLPDHVMSQELSTMADNVVISYYMRPSDDRRDGRRSRIVDRELLILKIRDSAFDAYPELFHITDKGVRFGRGEVTEQRPQTPDAAGESA